VLRQLGDPDLLENRSLPQRALVISGGVMANVLLSFFCAMFLVSHDGYAKPETLPGVLISQVVTSNGPAARAGLKSQDVVLSINGKKLDGILAIQDFQTIVQRNSLKFLDMEVQHKDGISEVLHVLPDANEKGRGSIGVTLTPHVSK
jgi:membrane-associated protease RseP (regulator of RpoE activity)